MMDLHNNITEKISVTTGYSASIKTFFLWLSLYVDLVISLFSYACNAQRKYVQDSTGLHSWSAYNLK